MALVGDMNYLTIDGDTYEIADAEARNDILLKAPLASPDFTGTPTAPTAASGDSSTQIATTAFVQDAMSGAGAGTVTSVGVSNATNGGLSVSGSPITTNGTITVGHSNVLSSAQSTQAVYPIKIDKNGHISGYGSAVTVPTKTSELTNDSGYITSYVDEKVKLNSNTDSSLHYMVFGPASVTEGNTYSLNYNSGFSFTPSTGNLQALKFNGYTLAGASAKSVDSSISDSSSSANLPTSAAVASFVEGKGYITSYTDTKNTAGSTNTTSSIYLIGATTQAANPQTYSNKNLHFTIDSDNAVLTVGSNQISQYDVNQAVVRLSGHDSNLSANYVTIQPDTITEARTLTLPDKTGTVALIGDIPTKVSELTNDSGYITTYTDEKMKWTASTSSNTYYPLQSTSTATTSTASTLNGINFYQYYNTAGGYRRLNLGNATSWKSSGGAYGTIRLYGAAATYYGDLVPGTLGTTSGDGHISANRTWTLPDKTGTVALTSDIPATPTATESATTGISIADHSTGSVTGVQSSTTSVRGVKTGTSSTTTASKASGSNSTVPTLGDPISVIGVQSSTTSVTGVQSSTTTASKVTVGTSSTDYGVTAAGSGSFTSGSFSGGSGSFSATVTNHVLSFSHTHTAATHGADSHTHTAPTLGSKVPTVSANDVTVPIKATSATTVPIKATSATEIPNVTSVGSASTWSFTDVTVPIRADSDTTVPIKDASASTFVTGTTHTITDNGHTHSI